MQSNSRAIKISALAAVTGAFIGAFVFAEVYIVNALDNMVDITFLGTNIFRLFDFELTVALFALIIFLLILIKLLSRTYSLERVFVILFIVGLQTTALTTMGRFDFSEIIIILFAFILLVKLFNPERSLTLTAFDLLNLFFIITLILPVVNNNIVMLVDSLVTGVKMFFIPLIFVNYLKDMDQVKFAIKWFLVMTFISSLIAIAQSALYLGTGYALIGFIERSELKFMFESTPIGTMLRVPAFFGKYKPFTFFLDASLLLLLNTLFYCRLALREKILISAVAGVMMTALILTFSKDAYLSFFIGASISIIVWRPRYLLHWVALALLVLALAEAFGVVDKAWESIHNEITWQEYRIRVLLANDGIYGFIYKHPWVGIGVRNTPVYTAHFNGWPAHNSFIQAADAGGVVGLLVYFALIAYTFKCLLKLLMIIPRGQDRWISMGLFTGFIAYVIMAQIHPFYLDRFLWLYMGLTKAAELKYIDPGPLAALSAA